MRSYTVVGAGAVGLLYGIRLADAGNAVRWVVRSGAEEIRARGLSLRSVDGDVSLDPATVEVYDDPSIVPPSDTVIVALKTTANPHLAELVGPAVAEGATVAMFQNGLGVEEALRVAVPHAGEVLGAMCFVCAHRVTPGVVDHTDYGAVTVGTSGAGDGVWGVVDDLCAAGIDATGVDDLAVARWRKLVWNVPFNGLSVVLDASTDELLGSPWTRQLVVDLMGEVIAGSAAAGHPVEPGFRDEMLATTEAMTPYAPSMKLDHDSGRPMEVAAIYDAPLAAAAVAGATMPKVEALRDQLRYLDPGSVGRP
jgi:2-dehydropantoate 2-reductase